MKNEKLPDKKLFLKRFWWLILILSFAEVFADGYIGLKEGFDWNFIYQSKTYIKLIYYIVCWSVGYFMLFLRQNPKSQETQNQQLDSKD